MDAYLIMAGGGHCGMGVARAEAMLRAMEEPCLFPRARPGTPCYTG